MSCFYLHCLGDAEDVGGVHVLLIVVFQPVAHVWGFQALRGSNLSVARVSRKKTVGMF